MNVKKEFPDASTSAIIPLGVINVDVTVGIIYWKMDTPVRVSSEFKQEYF